MIAYIRLSNLEHPLHEGDIRLEHPEITEDQTGDTFPCPPTYAMIDMTHRMANVGFYLVQTDPIPPGDPRNTSTEGYWQASYNEFEYTPEEIAKIKIISEQIKANLRSQST
jgi:hypothetical protein